MIITGTKALDELFFDFYSRKLSGQNQQKTSEKRSVGVINSWLGELLGNDPITLITLITLISLKYMQ